MDDLQDRDASQSPAYAKPYPLSSTPRSYRRARPKFRHSCKIKASGQIQTCCSVRMFLFLSCCVDPVGGHARASCLVPRGLGSWNGPLRMRLHWFASRFGLGAASCFHFVASGTGKHDHHSTASLHTSTSRHTTSAQHLPPQVTRPLSAATMAVLRR